MKVPAAAGIVVDTGSVNGFAVREEKIDGIADLPVMGGTDPAYDNVASAPELMDGFFGGVARI